MNTFAIWQEALSNLRQTMSQTDFDTWILPVFFEKIEDGVVVLSAPNGFVKGRLDSAYKARIEDELRRLGLNTRVNTVIRTSTSAAGNVEDRHMPASGTSPWMTPGTAPASDVSPWTTPATASAPDVSPWMTPGSASAPQGASPDMMPEHRAEQSMPSFGYDTAQAAANSGAKGVSSPETYQETHATFSRSSRADNASEVDFPAFGAPDADSTTGEAANRTVTPGTPDFRENLNTLTNPYTQAAAPFLTAESEHAYAQTHLNPEYTFDSFVPGDNSLFIYSTCRAIAANPGNKTYNPLLIYGGVGLGKTHLIQSIGNEIFKNFRGKKVLYTSTENFMNDYISSISQKSTNSNATNEFRKKYRGVDVLLLDDIQFLTGKGKPFQEEMFNTFNDLYEAKRQLVLTSDRPLKEIKDIEERLRTRFIKGFSSDIQAPDYETRMAIIIKKCEAQHYQMDREIMSFIAENVVNNVRTLEGCITRIVTYDRFSKEKMTLDVAKRQLKDIIFYNSSNADITITHIVKSVAELYEVDVDEIKGRSRTKNIVLPRQIAMYLCNKMLKNVSTTQIGQEFGGKDHSTVLSNVKKVEKLIAEPDSDLSTTITRLMGTIKNSVRKN